MTPSNGPTPGKRKARQGGVLACVCLGTPLNTHISHAERWDIILERIAEYEKKQ